MHEVDESLTRRPTTCVLTEPVGGQAGFSERGALSVSGQDWKYLAYLRGNCPAESRTDLTALLSRCSGRRVSRS
jgi:hypothetical protein